MYVCNIYIQYIEIVLYNEKVCYFVTTFIFIIFMPFMSVTMMCYTMLQYIKNVTILILNIPIQLYTISKFIDCQDTSETFLVLC